MAIIPTVRGRIGSDRLGVTLVHEHICLRNWPNDCAEEHWPRADQQVPDRQPAEVLRGPGHVNVVLIISEGVGPARKGKLPWN